MALGPFGHDIAASRDAWSAGSMLLVEGVEGAGAASCCIPRWLHSCTHSWGLSCAAGAHCTSPAARRQKWAEIMLAPISIFPALRAVVRSNAFCTNGAGRVFGEVQLRSTSTNTRIGEGTRHRAAQAPFQWSDRAPRPPHVHARYHLWARGSHLIGILYMCSTSLHTHTSMPSMLM